MSENKVKKKTEKDTYARGWVVTINNYTEDDIVAFTGLGELNITYLIGAYEIGKGTEITPLGTPHIQGFVRFKNACSFSSVQKKLKRAHIEASKGDDDSQEAYISKESAPFIQLGKKSAQGNRTDLTFVRDALKAGANYREVIDTAPSFQSMKVATEWLKYNEKGRHFVPEVVWYYGSSGNGKTKTALEWLNPEDVESAAIYQPVNFKWWEGYDAHELVLLDEIRKDFCKFYEMLKLLDRYPYRVECKNGSRQLLAKKIAITCPWHPETLWKGRTSEDLFQLMRRITRVVCVGTPPSDVYAIESEDELES